MKIELEKSSHSLVVERYADNVIIINGQMHSLPVVISLEQLLSIPVPPSVAELSINSLQAIMQMAPEVILIGSGQSAVFLPVTLIDEINRQGIGIECMTSPAACRTFSILSSESRSVVAIIY
ncbi:MAG: hypothetical protein HWE13_14420 [Gammaproteobacteria bacterium]|nr:hypothetical protein [Gammaproteobacteria bacterium]